MKKYAFGIDIGGTTVKIGVFSTEESQAGSGNQRSAIDVKRGGLSFLQRSFWLCEER